MSPLRKPYCSRETAEIQCAAAPLPFFHLKVEASRTRKKGGGAAAPALSEVWGFGVYSFIFFCRNCCHSATNARKALCTKGFQGGGREAANNRKNCFQSVRLDTLKKISYYVYIADPTPALHGRGAAALCFSAVSLLQWGFRSGLINKKLSMVTYSSLFSIRKLTRQQFFSYYNVLLIKIFS